MEQSPKKSIPQLSAQAGFLVGTCHKALKKDLHMHPYSLYCSAVASTRLLPTNTLL
ncbi:uncharacterized protein LOC108913653 isoform X2 [Anoplophora glabripennis]|uniref:uncharacterized protein LOC108913653 isoform X2 n=1 Tax=Anoplophora glabripennis TaxID=217634 RepID=UPI000875A84C|nr:uncharacterized protein LOC108913653 isoform X2 [Anoplophora glabripennis]